MSIKTWVTHPDQPFDSYYYYDTVTLNFVRIRLELGRTDEPKYTPDPYVFPEQNRYVGFVDNLNNYDFDDVSLWTVNADNAIVYKGAITEVLSKEPVPNKSTIDFTLPVGQEHPDEDSIHYGNPLVASNNANFPVNRKGQPVTIDMLRIIAEKVAHWTEPIKLGNSTDTPQELAKNIFLLYEILIGSTATKKTKPFKTQLQEAYYYFSNPELPEVGSYADNPYADKDGLIEIIIGNELIDDKKVMEKVTTLKGYLVALTSVVTDYVFRYAEAYGAEYRTNAALWGEAMSMLPLMGPGRGDEETYSNHCKGVSIASEFVKFLLDIVSQDGSAALNRFNDFLENQGEALKFGVESNKDYYSTITIGAAIEIMKIGKEIVYIPKVKQYKVNFDRQNTKWSGACASYEYVDINFEYHYNANVFDYEALDDKETKAEFDKFLQASRKAQIDKASTYFNADFPPKTSPIAAEVVR